MSRLASTASFPAYRFVRTVHIVGWAAFFGGDRPARSSASGLEAGLIVGIVLVATEGIAGQSAWLAIQDRPGLGWSALVMLAVVQFVVAWLSTWVN